MNQAEKQAKSRRSTSKQTTINLTEAMRDDYVAIATAEFGPRGHAKWIEQSLRDFINIPDFAIRVGASEANIALPAAKAITLTRLAEGYLEEGVLKVRRLDPMAENVRAQILRAAFANSIKKAGQGHGKLTAVTITSERPKLRRTKGAP